MLGGDGPIRLSGRGAGALARSIDQGGDTEEILRRAESWGMAPDRARTILAAWCESGHLVAAGNDGSPVIAVRLIDATDGLPDAGLLAQTLRAIGVSVDNDDHDATAVVITPHALALGAAGEHAGDRFIGVCVRGPKELVSPLLVKGMRGQCPTCLDRRLRHRLSAEVVAAQRLGLGVPPPHAIVHPSAIAACAAAIVHITAGGDDVARITSFDPITSTMERHVVVPVPGCPDCDAGGVTTRMRHLDGPLQLAPESFDSGGGGGFRTVDPEDTWDDHAHLVNDVVGLVPYVTPAPARELRAYVSGRNVAAVDDPVNFTSRLRSVTGGKGITRSGARAGALAEALERNSLRARGNEAFRCARLADLEGAIHPNEIELFSAAQLRRAEGLATFGLQNLPDAAGHRPVPLPFDTEAEHAWSPVADLRTGQTHWLPSSLVWFDWPGLTPGSYRGTSNGAAAGNTLEEAVLQGLLELVERDSVALWWHPMCHRPGFDLASWNDPRINAALAPQRALGTDVWVLDLTSDLGIPAAVAIAHGMSKTPAPMMGFGAHVDPALAVVRALTELAQMQSLLVGVDAGQFALAGPAEKRWLDEVTVESEPWLAPTELIPPPRTPAFATISQAIDDVAARIENAGMQVLWADCSRPDVPMHVVRTYAPGMRHFWNRYAAGRLYDVPSRLGWRDSGYGEADLNPWAMFL